MTGFYTKFTTKAEDRDTLTALLLEAARGMQMIPECTLYIVNQDIADIAVTWVSEVWTNHEAHGASLQLPDAKELIGKALPLLTEGPEQTSLEVLGGKGI